MKCSKCGYISFDHNQICPKCNKDITDEQEKLNLPAYRPSPPSLLGALTGEANESDINIQIAPAAAPDSAGQDLEIGGEDIGLMDEGEDVFDEGEDIDISIEPEWDDDVEVAVEGEEEPAISMDFSESEPSAIGEEDIVVEEPVSDLQLDEGEDEAISLDFDDITSEEPETEIEAAVETSTEEDESLELSLDDLTLDDSGEDEEIQLGDEEVKGEEAAIDFDSIPLDDDISMEPAAKDESLELNLDDISLDDSGPEEGVQLEDEEDKTGEVTIDLDSIALDDEDISAEPSAPEEDEALTVELDKKTPDEPASAVEIEPEHVLELDDEADADIDLLDLGEDDVPEDVSIPGTETDKQDEMVLNLDDLKVNETGELEIGQLSESPDDDMVQTTETDGISLDESVLEDLISDEDDIEEIDIDLDEEPSDIEDITELSELGEEDISLDLENLDLDFDLEEKEPK